MTRERGKFYTPSPFNSFPIEGEGTSKVKSPLVSLNKVDKNGMELFLFRLGVVEDFGVEDEVDERAEESDGGYQHHPGKLPAAENIFPILEVIE